MAEEWFQGLLESCREPGRATDQNANPGVSVTLDGSVSTDSLGAIVTFSWSRKAGSLIVALANPSAGKGSFTASSISGYQE